MTEQTAEVPTAEELRQRAEQRRAELGITTTSANGPSRAAASSRDRESTCRCGEKFDQVQILGRWMPIGCPACEPPIRSAPPAAPEQVKYSGDVLEDMRNAGVNVWKYGDATLENAKNTNDRDALIAHDPQALVAVERWVEECWRRPPRRQYPPRDWMYLYGAGSTRGDRQVQIGSLGNGKTYLAIAAARHLIEHGYLGPRRFRFATAESILLESEATFRANADDSEKNLLRRYERPDLLIIDDFGVRADPSPHATRLFDELTKLREAKATIWTSNLSVRVMAGANEFMRRIADRIAGECGDGAAYMVEFSGPSRRIARSRRTA